MDKASQLSNFWYEYADRIIITILLFGVYIHPDTGSKDALRVYVCLYVNDWLYTLWFV